MSRAGGGSCGASWARAPSQCRPVSPRSTALALVQLSLYRSRNFSATNALTLLLYIALGGALYYLPFGLIRLGGYSATQAGAALLLFP
jgi:hypothetical protein